MKQSHIHDQAYEMYNFEELGQDTFSIAEQILTKNHNFDRIIALAKGGLTYARSLVDFLAVDDVSSIKIEFYTGIGTTQKTPVITQSLPVSIKGERILIFDDIVDKGETMKLATEYLQYHGAADITTSALIQKPWTEFKVDYFARESEAWVIFPNEIRETISTLSSIWKDAGDSQEAIKEQLLEVGFSEKEVALFSSLE